MVSDRQARIAEIEEQIDMLDAEALRFLLDGFLGNNTLPVELVKATLDVVALITVGHVDRHDDGGLSFAQRDDTALHEIPEHEAQFLIRETIQPPPQSVPFMGGYDIPNISVFPHQQQDS